MVPYAARRLRQPVIVGVESYCALRSNRCVPGVTPSVNVPVPFARIVATLCILINPFVALSTRA